MPNGYAAWAARWRVPLGFALGLAYLIFSQPQPALLWVGSAMALLGLILRAWSAAHLVKSQQLTVTGPYAHTRNPLYLGSVVMGLGFAWAGGSWILGAAFIVYLLAVYWPVVRREEQSLRGAFGEAYERYAAAVPLFLPRLRPAPGPSQRGSWAQYRKNHEYEAALGYLAALLFLVLKTRLR
jgi:protein-S-isoprenylcysteine O-methyltransferase Ste14